jgi:hypothetical protein
MKAIVTLLLLLPFAGLAQDCPIRKEIDQFSQKPKLTTGFSKLDNGNVSYSIDATNAEIDFFFIFKSRDGKCFDDASTAVVQFDGTKSKMNLKNTGSMNCDGMIHFSYRNTTNTQYGLTRLSTFKVASIKFTGTDNKPVEIVFTEAEKDLFMKMAACIAAEAKTLNAVK